MRAPSALCVCAFLLASPGYSQTRRHSQVPPDDLGNHGVIPAAPGTEQRAASGIAPALVSLAELRHTPPAKAQREMRAARKACAKGDLMACVDRLKKAVDIDPEFLEARLDLGRVYVHLDQPQNVIEAYQAVLRIDSRSADAYSFIGAAEASLTHYSDAEAAARRALRIVPNHPLGRFVLGLSLAALRKNDREALECLEESTSAYPQAHMFAAHVLARRGQTSEARSHLEAYIQVAPNERRAEVENWLSRLDPTVASHPEGVSH